MVGMPIDQVQDGMCSIIQSLRVDPYALETVFVSIIVFAGKAKVLSPLTELYRFYPPVFPIGGGTSLGKGLECLMDDIDRNVRKNTTESKGDWKPIVFLFTDGNPTDSYAAAFRKWNERYRKHCNLVAVSIGENVNILTLAQITNDVLLLKETDAESFSQFFRWVTDSIRTSSISVGENDSSELKLAPTTGINLEKMDMREVKQPVDVDENFVVLHGRCSTTRKEYLVKYARQWEDLKRGERYVNGGFNLVGAYPIDSESYEELADNGSARVNSRQLTGVPACPCCGNQLGVVVCECGNVFCVGERAVNECPWCGLKGELGSGDGAGFDLTRGLG